ncbi:MAG: hypothetical protein C7B43_16745 [Sulfobacillus benefaciens]|uniref:Uncharacterized protein n=1 Tax=Sulfobacillus benefaciens TaxID=453960 RepID=A0A2T2WTI4_9FIRM|nr:MAG: hypothetical protein C7B43_16745 [Sulfobacillus benefaciens]
MGQIVINGTPDSAVLRSMINVIRIQRVTQTDQIPTAIFEIDLQDGQPIMEIRVLNAKNYLT